jgi:hypothetical protein
MTPTAACKRNPNHKRKWYNKTNGKSINQMKHYKTNSCMSCAFFDQCTKKQKGRLERSQYADVIYQNKIQIETIMKYTEDDKPLWNILMVSSKTMGLY